MCLLLTTQKSKNKVPIWVFIFTVFSISIIYAILNVLSIEKENIMPYTVARVCILFAFYILSAYATTDILRLLKGSTLPVNSAHCYCPNCNSKIALKDQIPILSYFLNHGKCKSCGCKIPPNDLFLEIFFFLSFSAITVLFRFRWTAYFLCVALYEIVKCIFIIIHGRREKDFAKNLLCSLRNNLLLFLFLAFPFALLSL